MVVGGVITVVIGGTAYTVNQTDIVKNFANDTGLSQQEAEKYVGQIKEEDLVSYEELGNGHIDEGKQLLSNSDQIDCTDNQYDWESSTLTCDAGKAQLQKTGRDSIKLGESYKKLSSESASKNDISATIGDIDTLNSDYDAEIITKLLSKADIDDAKKTNSYNRATLKTTLDSN